MKKKIAVLLCVLLMIFACTVVVAAEEGATGEGGETLWSFWDLLSGSNVDYIGVAVMLLTTLLTIFRVFFANGGAKNLWEVITNMIKEGFPISKS